MRNVETRRFVGLHQRERRARDLERRIARQGADQSPCERRFSGTKVALEPKHVARLQKKSDLAGKPGNVAFGEIGVKEGTLHCG